MIGTGCHVIETGCTLGRASSTKETLPDFHKWYQVTRHPRISRGLTGYQWTPGFGASHDKTSAPRLGAHDKGIMSQQRFLYDDKLLTVIKK